MKSQKKLAFAFIIVALFALPLLNGTIHPSEPTRLLPGKTIDDYATDNGTNSDPLAIGVALAEISTATSGEGNLHPVTEYAEGLFEDRRGGSGSHDGKCERIDKI